MLGELHRNQEGMTSQYHADCRGRSRIQFFFPLAVADVFCWFPRCIAEHSMGFP